MSGEASCIHGVLVLLMDVSENFLVRSDSDVQYFVLSYVWVKKSTCRTKLVPIIEKRYKKGELQAGLSEHYSMKDYPGCEDLGKFWRMIKLEVCLITKMLKHGPIDNNTKSVFRDML